MATRKLKKLKIAGGVHILFLVGGAAQDSPLLEGGAGLQGSAALPSMNCMAGGKLIKFCWASVSSSVNKKPSLMTSNDSAHLRASCVSLEGTGPHEEEVWQGPCPHQLSFWGRRDPHNLNKTQTQSLGL